MFAFVVPLLAYTQYYTAHAGIYLYFHTKKEWMCLFSFFHMTHIHKLSGHDFNPWEGRQRFIKFSYTENTSESTRKMPSVVSLVSCVTSSRRWVVSFYIFGDKRTLSVPLFSILFGPNISIMILIIQYVEKKSSWNERSSGVVLTQSRNRGRSCNRWYNIACNYFMSY